MVTPRRFARLALLATLSLLVVGVIAARARQTQSAPAAPRVLTTADYAHAERYMGYNTTDLVVGNTVVPDWLPDGRLTYRVTTLAGSQFMLVDPVRGTREPAFDAARLAAALSSVAGSTYTASDLPFTAVTVSADNASVAFTADGKRWRCDRQGSACAIDTTPAPAESGRGRGGRGGGRGAGGRGAAAGGVQLSPSPDGKSAVFIRDYNLWLRDTATRHDTQLTTDGVKDFGYATDNAGWSDSDRAVVLWSPDSKKIATFQQDQRGDGDMYLVSTPDMPNNHPTLRAWKYPLPGDKVVTTIQRVVIDVSDPAAPKVVRFQMPPDQHRSTTADNLAWGEDQDVQWSPDSSNVAFISTSRDHKVENLRVADASTGAIREVYQETAATQYEGGQGGSNFRYLPESNEFIWYSQRDNWGQLYLYDLTTGKLKHAITTGVGDVDSVQRLDAKNRTVYFYATGKEAGRDPYFINLYKANLDGSGQTLLTPEDANHTTSFSPDGKYFVDTFSTPTQPPTIVLRDSTTGKLVETLGKADISKLTATGWKPPIPIKVKARDGVTDLYGLMFVPFNLEPGRKYPIINHIYPGPQTGSVGGRNWSAAHGDCDALAQLGFVVVELDGLGTPWRGQKFHDAYYGDMKDNTLPDQVDGMKQLAARYPYIDINRAGIYGHSGGGDATADAMFRYPDFFKVGIAESGNHDQREYEDDWGERYMALNVPKPGGGMTYDGQSNEEAAKNLKGHLLLAHGSMDNNVPPYNTLLVVDALIKANKDFDLIFIPNKPHGYGDAADYMQRRRWDYFTRYLMGAEPPNDYLMHANSAAPGGGRAGRGRRGGE